jgi:Tol biopolymer transport system component
MLLNHPKNQLWEPQICADNRWIAFIEAPTEGHSSVHLAPLRPKVTPEDGTAITSASLEDDKPRWSPAGEILYYTPIRDGFRCNWGAAPQSGYQAPCGRNIPRAPIP